MSKKFSSLTGIKVVPLSCSLDFRNKANHSKESLTMLVDKVLPLKRFI